MNVFSSNDRALVHRFALNRCNSLLGLCQLLLGNVTSDEEYDALREAKRHIQQAHWYIKEVCIDPAPDEHKGSIF